MSVGPRIIIHGDEELGSRYRDMAVLELAKLKDLMKFQGLKQDRRKTVFEDGTVIKCQSVFGEDIIIIEAQAVKAEEEKEEKEYEEGGLVVVLRKLVDGEYDYWYWNLMNSQGHHANPGVEVSSTPEIVSKWWSCEALAEVEYYTRATPSLAIIATEGCNDSCGLINFDEECCGDLQGAADDLDTWHICPCGGEWLSGESCTETIQCTGGCSPAGSEDVYHPTAQSTQNRTSNQSQNCPLGYSWGLNIGDLAEKIEIGPRSRMQGSEGKSIWTVQNAACGPYESQLFHCEAVNYETCQCTTWYDPARIGYECHGSFKCTGWESPSNNRLLVKAWGWGYNYQGCVDFLATEKDIVGYNTETTPIVTKVQVGTKETLFEGSWSQYVSNEGNEREGEFRAGQPTICLPCPDAGGSWGDYVLKASYSFSELSYGVGGWRTVVAADGRFAVLIPKMDLTAAATSTGGVVTGTIGSTTTALLRIVDDSEHNYELADAEKNYSLTGLPSSRGDLGIKPNCWPQDLPLDLNLCGFHWLVEVLESGGVVTSRMDSLLTAFVIASTFYAHLSERTLENPWQNQELLDFEQWVVDNSLESYVMYLGRKEDEEDTSD